jgi:hypothetical protein
MRSAPNESRHDDLLSPADLLARYISDQAHRIQQGDPAPDLGSEVVLHDASSAQAIDARLAWDEAVAALKVGRPAGSVTLPLLSAVPEWKSLVAAQEPALDLAFCTGNFPQMVRNLSLLLQAKTGVAVTPSRSKPCLSSALIEWSEAAATKPFPQVLIAVGLMRLAQDFDRAAALAKKCVVPAEWRSAATNEEAALAWHSGRRAEARDLWLTRGDDNHLPTLFNRGMAALFLGKPADARAPLAKAVSGLSEDNSWHHLARLYLTLAEMRG